MKIEIVETSKGDFQVVQLIPELLGTFPQRHIAEKFSDFICDDQNAQEHPNVLEQAAAPIEEIKGEPALVEPEQVPLPEPAQVTTRRKPKRHNKISLWSDKELTAAFKCLEDGETLADVAAQAGKSVTSLEERWKKHRRNLKKGTPPAPQTQLAILPDDQETSPLEKFCAAIEHVRQQEKCIGCAKSFTPSPNNLDLCARCSNGL